MKRIIRLESRFIFHLNNDVMITSQAANTFEVKCSFIRINVKSIVRFISQRFEKIDKCSIVTQVVVFSL